MDIVESLSPEHRGGPPPLPPHHHDTYHYHHHSSAHSGLQQSDLSPSLVDSSGSGPPGGNPNAMDLSNELWHLQASHGNPDFMPEPYHHISKEVIGGQPPPPPPSSSGLPIPPPNYANSTSTNMAGFDLEVLRGHHQSHLEAAAAAHHHYAAAGGGPHYPGHYEMDNNNEMMFIEAATATSVASGDSYHPSSALVTPMEFNMATHEVMIGGGQFEDHVHPHFTS